MQKRATLDQNLKCIKPYPVTLFKTKYLEFKRKQHNREFIMYEQYEQETHGPNDMKVLHDKHFQVLLTEVLQLNHV